MPDRPDPHTAAVLDAYLGEIWGAAWFATLAELRDDPREKRKLEILAILEEEMAAVLLPIVRASSGIDVPDLESAREKGKEMAREQAAWTWQRIAENMAEEAAHYLTLYAALAGAAPGADKSALGALVEHEAALLLFARAEAAGRGAASLDAVQQCRLTLAAIPHPA